MKTAVIVAGVCRFTDIARTSWTMMPEADWYLSTWDISQQPYSKNAIDSKKEIKNIEHLFKTIVVSNYQTEYLEQGIKSFERPFILLEKIFNIIKDKKYERIIYFRPDLMLYKVENFSTNDFDIDDSCVKLLDIHSPELAVRHAEKVASDLFFVFTWNTFVKFVNAKKEIVDHFNIHRTVYKFFTDNNIEMLPLHNMRSMILRNNVYQSLGDLSWETLSVLFHDIFRKLGEGKVSKFPYDIELTPVVDYKLLESSKLGGGILKLRNK